MIDLLALVLFPALMAYSAWSDIFTMTIANWISVLLVAGFVLLAAISGMPLQGILIDHLACGAAVLTITFSLFAFGWIGGGDAKLAAATAVWIGWSSLSDYGLLASLFGAALTLGILWFRRTTLPQRLSSKRWIVRLHDKAGGVPYGVALAGAGLLLYPETALWQTVVGA
jgi:prepilin peptidase CpaA